ncbi:uncharacterized protein UTRI_03292_B [Ustilago trichophora]|uniref:Uncharacterized protein n=1 Tax=Ustilago trichophora TaxID=86804 RepID=A0A5C3E4I7_9BASI|nr:uncharacterized protein UTRI_03292_B [Ustilago trichophora]
MDADCSGDPNFPRGLRIQPSSLHRSIKSAQNHALNGTQNSQAASGDHSTATNDAEAASWGQDTAEDIKYYGIAGRIWEAAYLLARYVHPANQLAGDLAFDPPCSLFDRPSSERLTIVELGSGAGYGSLHLARQLVQHAQSISSKLPQARLVLTDLENVVPLMERNVARAGYQQASNIIDVRVRSLAWGNSEHASNLLSELSIQETAVNPLSHILCSDLVYFPQLLPPLLRSIISLSGYGLADDKSNSSAKTGPELIISYKIRSLTKEQPFWAALGSWFDFQAVDCRTIPRKATSTDDEPEVEWHRFGSQGQDYGATADSDQELFVFVGHRRKDTIGCLAPECDADLMQGKRLRPRPASDDDDFELVSPSSGGEDYFEWLLLSNMGAGLG